MFLLDEACKPINAGLGEYGCYHVGTSAERGAYRDVDVRFIMGDKQHDRLTKVLGKNGIVFLGLSIGEYLASRTGLPIDFQIQRQTEANVLHKGFRNPLGHRDLSNYKGDAQTNDAEAARAKTLEELEPELFKGLQDAQAAGGRLDIDGQGVHLGPAAPQSRDLPNG